MRDCSELNSRMVMRRSVLACLVWLVATVPQLAAQDLAPRAYVITPVNSNAVTLTWSFYSGGLNFNGTVPIANANGTYYVSILSYYRSLNLFGRSANFTASVPYGVGNFQGDVAGQAQSVYRSGMLDSIYRISVNLMGGPAMQRREMATWRQKRLLGASLKVVAPTGQYSGAKLINWGGNRWAFKPELGYSERWGHWVLDGFAGVWFYTTNPSSFGGPITAPQNEAPVGSLEGHASYDLKPRLWVSIDGNFWWGGIASLSGVQNLETKQIGSRVGATASVPISKHQSMKVSYSDGTYIRFGGNYQSISAAWQYSWFDRRNE
jgi:outer membrane putative beta-barrel porin/alpha-amylase